MSTLILNPFEIFGEVGEVPIMSFQTDLNGTFDPLMTIASGTLRWIIDGEEQITNSPSKVLTGSTVDVEVFANTVPLFEDATGVSFISMGVIGELSLLHFTIAGNVRIQTNSGCDSVVFSDEANDYNSIQLNNNNIENLDLSSFENSAGQLWLQNNNVLTDIVWPPSSANNTSSYTHMNSIAVEDIDLRGYVCSGNMFLNSIFELLTLQFSSSNTSSRFELTNCPLLSSANINSFIINGICKITNTGLSSIVFNAGANSSALFECRVNPNVTSLDLSSWTFTKDVSCSSSVNLASIVSPIYTQSLETYNFSSCALDLATVDGELANMNTYYSANAPTVNLVVDFSLGTSSSPTDGSSNTDLVNLRDVVYPGAGFTFTATIN